MISINIEENSTINISKNQQKAKLGQILSIVQLTHNLSNENVSIRLFFI